MFQKNNVRGNFSFTCWMQPNSQYRITFSFIWMAFPSSEGAPGLVLLPLKVDAKKSKAIHMKYRKYIYQVQFIEECLLRFLVSNPGCSHQASLSFLVAKHAAILRSSKFSFWEGSLFILRMHGGPLALRRLCFGLKRIFFPRKRISFRNASEKNLPNGLDIIPHTTAAANTVGNDFQFICHIQWNKVFLRECIIET